MSEIYDDQTLRLWGAACEAAGFPDIPPGTDVVLSNIPQFHAADRLGEAAERVLSSAIPRTPTQEELVESIPEDSVHLRRGITIRSLFPAEARDVKHVVDYVRRMAPLGLQARFGKPGPVRIAIVDGRVAMLQISPGRTLPHGFRLTCIPGIVTALQRQFDDSWDAASDLGTGDIVPLHGTAELTEREEIVLAGLIAGAPTKAIATTIGMSPSTVERTIASMAKRFNVTTRPALASAATRAGWTD